MSKPNILFLMADQMQGRVLEPGSPCQTPNIDRVIERGVRIERAYTPNAVCSPARASLMTGLLPHSHGVLWVTHCVDKDQGNLRTEHPHWAQRLSDAGYRTGYFGKWHVERSEDPSQFGWQVDGGLHGRYYRDYADALRAKGPKDASYSVCRYNDQPEGYKASVHYAVTDYPMAYRPAAMVTDLAERFLNESLGGNDPWCCFVSVPEPHDPFVCGQEAFDRYNVDNLPVPENRNHDLCGRPNIYRRSADVFAGMTERQRKEAAACYYGRVTELDAQFGRLLDLLEKHGQLDNTIIVVTSDHGELLGAHGSYCKNFSAYEEIYNIPMVLAGPGIERGKTSAARVGLHYVGDTLLELTDLPPLGHDQCKSFAPVLRKPADAAEFTRGYAEYFGTRYVLSQRVYWDGPWKLVLNGFDYDELYNLDADPGEMNNLAADPAQRSRVRSMVKDVYAIMKRTGEKSIMGANYPPLRIEAFGPGILNS